MIEIGVEFANEEHPTIDSPFLRYFVRAAQHKIITELIERNLLVLSAILTKT